MEESAIPLDKTPFWMVTTCGFIGAFIPFFVKMVMQIITRETEMEANLRRQVCDLKAELGGISMVDEFAKFAKIQRKVNKITDELAHQSQVRTAYTMKVQFLASLILYAVMSLVVCLLMWNYSKTAVLVLPEHWLYPFSSILAFPSSVPGGIGLAPWLFVSGTVGRILASYVS